MNAKAGTAMSLQTAAQQTKTLDTNIKEHIGRFRERYFLVIASDLVKPDRTDSKSLDTVQ